MPKQKPSLGTDCPIDVDKLVESRLLIQANSGAGKSWAIRRLLEQTYGRVQQILIDVDGEFHTLREKFDYVLAGPKGECAADIKSAAKLAERLLELNVSTIIDIYELGTQKKLFVKRFLDALVAVRRDLWHPVLIVIDEAHIFAPEAGQAESASAVIDLMTLGRKRGFCGVLATQRISKLHKDAAAECNNKLIGRSALDIDMKRAASELGFTTREDTHSLRTLQAGEFYAFGPAISNEVRQIKVGSVKTTHLRAGQRAAPPTPPRDRVKKILAQLANLPHEAEEDAKSIVELRLQVKQLKTELTKAKAVQPVAKAEPKTELKIVEHAVVKDKQIKRIEALIGKGEQLRDKVAVVLADFGMATNSLKAALALASKPIILPVKQPTKAPKGFVLTVPAAPAPRAPRHSNGQNHGTYDGKSLPKGEVAVLRAAIQFSDGLFKKQLTVLTGYKLSTRNAYILRLREKGLLGEDGDRIYATPEGIAAMPNAEPLPTGEALRDFWYGELPSGERQVLQILIEAYPNTVEKPAIDEATGFKLSTRNAYLLRLGAKELVVEVGRAEVKASDTLFGDV